MQKRVKKIIPILEKEYPERKSSLRFRNPLEMLISTILSAQCTDVRVNIVTKELFKKYKTAEDYANADLKILQNEIRSIGFFRNKAKNIKKTGGMLVEEFNGNVPSNMDDLLKLHGVARKTANIVLNNSFGKSEGIAVDTHVKRISFRLGLTDKKDPNKVELDLLNIVPKKTWLHFNHLLVSHGRKVCKAPIPICSKCKLSKLCPKNGVVRSK
ncbi:MAG: endonuclease III [Nanoarchaeota archaeon]|nr:endonuclease III [Nanoarchaeota archaeon]